MRYLLLVLIPMVALAQHPTVPGRITDSVTHQPIADAKASCEHGGEKKAAVTGIDEVYRLALEPGSYETLLEVSKEGYASPGLEAFERMVLRIGPDTAETHDFELVRAASLCGRITDRDSGAPIPGLVVTALRDVSLAGQSFSDPSHMAPTDDAGVFTIPNMLPAEYVLRINPPELSSKSNSGYAAVWHPGVPLKEMAAPVKLSSGEERRIDLRLAKQELRRIEGTIEAPDSLRDSRDKGVSNVILALVPEGGTVRPERFANLGLRQALTVPDGAFHFKDVGPGRYRIVALKGGNPEFGQPIVVEPGQTVNVELHSN